MINGPALDLKKDDDKVFEFVKINRSSDQDLKGVEKKFTEAWTKHDQTTGTYTQYCYKKLKVGADLGIVLGNWARMSKSDRETFQPKDGTGGGFFYPRLIKTRTPTHCEDKVTKIKLEDGSQMELHWRWLYFGDHNITSCPKFDNHYHIYVYLEAVVYKNALLAILPKSPVAKVCEMFSGSFYSYDDEDEDLTQSVPWSVSMKE
jgi:hypothetical protein